MTFLFIFNGGSLQFGSNSFYPKLLNETRLRSRATARQSRYTAEKYSLLFSFCARRIFSFIEKEYFSEVSCLPSIQAGGGTGLILISQEKSEIPPKPPFRFSFAQTEREREQVGKNSFPPTPFLFARLLGLRPQNFSADGRRDLKFGGG